MNKRQGTMNFEIKFGKGISKDTHLNINKLTGLVDRA